MTPKQTKRRGTVKTKAKKTRRTSLQRLYDAIFDGQRWAPCNDQAALLLARAEVLVSRARRKAAKLALSKTTKKRTK